MNVHISLNLKKPVNKTNKKKLLLLNKKHIKRNKNSKKNN